MANEKDPLIDTLMSEKKNDEIYLDYMINNLHTVLAPGTDFGNGITFDSLMESMKKMRDGKGNIFPDLPLDEET